MKDVKARAVFGADKKFETTTIERRDVGPKDVLIEIKYAGICHSDIHTARGEWREIDYPLVPGHEIVGVVAEVGAEVSKYKTGDTVGGEADPRHGRGSDGAVAVFEQKR